MTAALIAVGLVSGVLTGLLGIGGGLVLVPALAWLLPSLVPAGILMKSCIATAFAVILFTGTWAAWLQQRAGNFDLAMAAKLSLGVSLGALLGSAATALAPEAFLRWFFIAFALYVAANMLTSLLPQLQLRYTTKTAVTAGALTGVVSSLVGVGGATLVVPYLTWCNVGLKKAVGVATGVGVTTAAFASLGYWLSARAAGVDLPGFLGYVNLAVLLPLVACCMAGAVAGVKLSTRVNVALLKKMFAVVLLASAAKMAWTALGL